MWIIIITAKAHMNVNLINSDLEKEQKKKPRPIEVENFFNQYDGKFAKYLVNSSSWLKKIKIVHCISLHTCIIVHLYAVSRG